MDYGSIIKFVTNRFSSCYTNSNYYTNIGEWLEWYRGNVKSFHSIKVSNGLTTPTREIYALKMAKRVCEDWASSMLNEDVNIVVNSNNKKSSIFVQGSKGNSGVLGSNNFDVLLSQAIEQMFALGTSALIIDLDNIAVDEQGNVVDGSKATIKLKSVNATRIIPISWSNGVVTEASFVSELVHSGKTYYVVSSHIKEDDGYVIYNDLIDTNYKTVSLNINLLPVLRTKSLKPLFYIMKTNIANNIDLDSPMGLSIYANAIDTLKGCDVAYDCCLREVITGQRIVMMNKCLLTTDDSGRPIAPQDVKQTYMQFFGDDAQSDVSEFIKEFHPTLNTDALDKELQNQLNMLSSKVGLGSNYYRFDSSSGVVTATEYVGERNDFMRNAVKISKSIKIALKDLVLGILFVGKNILGANVDDNAKIDITLSDGVVEDDTKEREQDRQDVRDGIMTKAEYRAKWYGETIEEAKAVIDSISNNNI
jgi:A118 family predicted phage portal protein|nr:MAG TPA: portal protein [Caudoviricetes sp.]